MNMKFNETICNEVYNLLISNPLANIKFHHCKLTSTSIKATNLEINWVKLILKRIITKEITVVDLSKFNYSIIDGSISGDKVNERIMNSTYALFESISSGVISYCIIHRNYTIYIHITKPLEINDSKQSTITIIAINNTSPSIIVHKFRMESLNNVPNTIKLHRSSGSPYKGTPSNINEYSYEDFITHDHLLSLVAESLENYRYSSNNTSCDIDENIDDKVIKEYEFSKDEWFRRAHTRKLASGKITSVRATMCKRQCR